MKITAVQRFFPTITRPPIDLGSHFFTVVGTPVIPSTPRQKLMDIKELQMRAKKDWPELMRIMHTACDVAGIDHRDAKKAAAKKLERAFQKASCEKGGRADLIMDYMRGTIYATSAEQILALADHFRPLNNSNTVSFVDNFSRPDETKQGLRRMKIVTKLDSGFLAEIMVIHKDFEEELSKTHTIYKQVRTIEAEHPNLNEAPIEVQQSYNELQQTRRSIHDHLAESFNLKDLEENRRYYLCDRGTADEHDDVPFMVVTRERGDLTIAVRPDPKTGMYIIDNSLLVHARENSNSSIEISREEFLMASMDLVHAHQNPNEPDLKFIDSRIGEQTLRFA